MDNATKYNISVIAMLNYPAQWVDENTRNYVPPEMLPEYLEYVNKTVRRYKDTVAMWEIWNEPNLEGFWDGPIEHYYPLFGQAVDLIHGIDPDLYILGSSLSAAATGWMPPNCEEMFKRGLMEHVDAISIHFYGFDADTLYQGINQYIVIGERYNFTGDYLITEIGNPTGGPYPHHVTHTKLAENVIKKLVISSALKIKTFIWYCTKDSRNSTTGDPRNSEHWFGLMYNNYTWKKGAYAFSLFSNHCSNSIYSPHLLIKSGIISSWDLMASLYRKTNGDSTLIMWYAPTMYESGYVRVNLDLSAITGSVYIHDIFTGTSQLLSNNSILVGDSPIFITFQVEDASYIIRLHIEESFIAWSIYICVFGTFFISVCITVLYRRRENRAVKESKESKTLEVEAGRKRLTKL